MFCSVKSSEQEGIDQGRFSLIMILDCGCKYFYTSIMEAACFTMS